MNLVTLKKHIPLYANELVDEVDSLITTLGNQTTQDPTLAIVALTAGFSSAIPDVTTAMIGQLSPSLSIEEIDLARKTAIAEQYLQFGVQRDSAFATTEDEQYSTAFELSLIAAAAMKGHMEFCKACIEKARESGVEEASIQASLQFSATLSALGQVLLIEQHIVFKPNEQAA